MAAEARGPAARVRRAFELALGRAPAPGEAARCAAHLDAALAHHRAAPPPARRKPPTYVVREMVEEMTGLSFYWVEDLDIYRDSFVPDAKPWDATPEQRALAAGWS